MNLHKSNEQSRRLARIKPSAMLGAGRLVSTIWKTGNQQVGWHSHFNLFRMTNRGQVGQRFSAADLFDLIKLTRLLASTLAEESCVLPVQRRELASLAAALDQIIDQKG